MTSEILDAAEHGYSESKPLYRITPKDFPEDAVEVRVEN
jgi:hypothetical protein